MLRVGGWSAYNASHQPTVLAIAQRLPAAFFQGEAALNFFKAAQTL
jgi:hypothetical protein